jgi:hypothetical protein
VDIYWCIMSHCCCIGWSWDIIWSFAGGTQYSSYHGRQSPYSTAGDGDLDCGCVVH